MSDTAVIEKIEMLTRTVILLETRVEQLETHENLRDFEKAMVENGDKPLVPWDQAKALLDLD